AAAELRKDGREQLVRGCAARGASQDVPWTSEGVPRLLESEVANVARDRCLRDDAAGVRERIEQLELRADALPRHDALDQAVPVGLRQHALDLHIERILCRVWRTHGRANRDPCCASCC